MPWAAESTSPSRGEGRQVGSLTGRGDCAKAPGKERRWESGCGAWQSVYLKAGEGCDHAVSPGQEIAQTGVSRSEGGGPQGWERASPLSTSPWPWFPCTPHGERRPGL